MKTKIHIRIISSFLILTILFSLVACSTPQNSPEEPETDENGNLVVDGVVINDSFVQIDFNETMLNSSDAMLEPQ